jgi:hypothetical protein
MGKTIRKFSKKRKQTQNKRKTKGRKPIRRKSVRHSRKRGGNTEIPYEDMKPAYDVRFEVERAAKALDDPKTVNDILIKLSSDRKVSCIRAYKNRVNRYLYKNYQYSDAEKACELLKQRQYLKAYILGKLIGLEDNIMKKIKEKIERKGIDKSIDTESIDTESIYTESIDPETKKQAYAELIFIRMYTLILKKIKKEYDCRNIYWEKYNELVDQVANGDRREKPTKKEIIDNLTKEHIKKNKNEDCVSIYPKMKENEKIRFNAKEIEVGDVEKVKHDDKLQQLKDLFHGELDMELGEYFNTLFNNAFLLAKKNMIKVQEYDLTINRGEMEGRGLILDNIDTTTAEQERSDILDNNMRIT